MYYRARYYAQGLGRFISADTIVPKSSNPQQFNRYAYVLNNPLRYVDPSGHFTEDQLKQWTSLGSMYDKQRAEWIKNNQDLYKMLLQMHFGDRLYFNWGDGDLEPMGEAFFNQVDGHLQFSWASSLDDLAARYNSMLNDKYSRGYQHGLVLGRNVGDNRLMSVVYWSGDWSMDHQRQNGFLDQWIRPYAESESSPTWLAAHGAPIAIGAGIGAVASYAAATALCGATGGWSCPIAWGFVTGALSSLAVDVAYPVKEKDITLEYMYGNGMKETTVIRDRQVSGPNWTQP
jgi:hypothetical protein